MFKSGTISTFASLVWAAFGLEYGFSEDVSVSSLDTGYKHPVDFYVLQYIYLLIPTVSKHIVDNNSLKEFVKVTHLFAWLKDVS